MVGDERQKPASPDIKAAILPSIESAFGIRGPAAAIIMLDATRPTYHTIEAEDERRHLVYRYKALFSNRGEVSVQKPRFGNMDAWSSLHSDFEARLDEYRQLGDSHHMVFIRQEEAERMAQILFSPSTETTQITERQIILEQLAQSEDLDRLIELKNGSYKLMEGVHGFLVYYGGHHANEARLIDHIYRGYTEIDEYDDEYGWGNPTGKEDLQPYVAENHEIIAEGMEALRAFAALDNPTYQQLFGNLSEMADIAQETINTVAPPDVANGEKRHYPPEEAYYNPDGNNSSTIYKFWRGRHKKDDYHDSFDPLEVLHHRLLEPRLMQIGAVLELAKRIRDDGWGKATFDKTKPAGYQIGWNLEKAKRGQVTNDSTSEAPIVLLSGANTSGKSFAMRTDFFVRIAGQSLGFVPAEAANLQIYKDFIYLDRATTNSANDLSAFMQEVENWKQTLPFVGEQTRLYCDEGYATTSPQDQAQLLQGTAEYIQAQGGSVMLATHNDVVLANAENDTRTAVYHLATDVDEEGKLVRYFRLEEGPSDSFALEVARARNFSPATLAWVENYLMGSTEQPVPLVGAQYPSVEGFSSIEREAQKQEVRSLEHMFPNAPVDQILHLYSTDPDFQVDRFAAYLLPGQEKDLSQFLSSEKNKALIAKFILWTPQLTGAEVLERRQLLDMLGDEKFVKGMQRGIEKGMELDGSFAQLRKALQDGINNSLNPVSNESTRRFQYIDPTQEHTFDSSTLKRVIAFFNLQQKLLQHNFTYSQLLSNFTSFASIYNNAYERAYSVEERDAGAVKPDRVLNENEKMQFMLATFGEKDLPEHPTMADVSSRIHSRFLELQSVAKSLPGIPLEQINPAELEEELKVLGGEDGEGLAGAVQNLSKQVRSVKRFIRLLKTTDSIYLHQAANFLNQEVANNLAVVRGKKPEAEVLAPQTDKMTLKQFEHLMRREVNPLSIIEAGFRKSTRFEQTLEHLSVAAQLAQVVRKPGFVPVEFNDTGEMKLANVASIFKKREDEVVNDVSLSASEERVQMLTGPNGSGKTFYEKGTIAAIMFGLATGYIPAESATMPVFDAVAYLDRVVEKQSDELSAFSQELEYWRQVQDLLQNSDAAFIAVDEAFSTTSPKYQAAFTYAEIAEVLKGKHFLQLSTHNHDVVHRLQQDGLQLVAPHHFAFSAEDGKVAFSYKLRAGHETSYAVEVANTMGLPQEIVIQAGKK